MKLLIWDTSEGGHHSAKKENKPIKQIANSLREWPNPQSGTFLKRSALVSSATPRGLNDRRGKHTAGFFVWLRKSPSNTSLKQKHCVFLILCNKKTFMMESQEALQHSANHSLHSRTRRSDLTVRWHLKDAEHFQSKTKERNSSWSESYHITRET